MHTVLKRGVHAEEHGLRPANAMPDWENIRVFLAVIRGRSFRAAAEALGSSINHIRNRVERLEHEVGAKLLTRHTDGVRVTAEGQRILDAAAQMEAAAFSLMRKGQRQAHKLIEGTVSISITDGLGVFWLLPQIPELQRAYPRLLIDLRCKMSFTDVGRMEADIAIQLSRPTAPDLIAVRLGRQFIAPYASRGYVETYGLPRTREELLRHRVVILLAEQGRGLEYLDQVFPDRPPSGFVAMHTNLSTAHYWAIASGAGIGWLPTYVAAFSGNLIPIGVEIRFPFDIWMTYHPEAAEIPRVRKVLDRVIARFDAAQYPWFRDQFVSAEELLTVYRGKPLTSCFSAVLQGRSGDAGMPKREDN